MRSTRSPAGHACGRARCRARNHSAVHGPSPRCAVIVARTSSSGRSASASRSTSLRASATAYSAFRCVKPTAKSSSSCACAIRSRVGNAHASPDPLAEALDQPVPDRDRGEQRHLLGGDRGDERLERVRLERRAEAVASRSVSSPIGPSAHGVEGVQVEGRPEQRHHDRPRLVVERVDVDAAARGRDRDVAPADRTVQHAVDEAVREVRAERLEPARRERVVERLGKPEECQTCEVTPAWSSAAASSAHENM